MKPTLQRPIASALRALALLLALVVFALPAAAQGNKKVALNAPENCPYCKGDKKLLEAAGLVSHGPFPFGKSESTKVDELLVTCEILWVETKHFRIGFALDSYKVKLEEKKKVLAELTRLHEVLPDVKPETQILDPWLRLHMYAQRCEDLYARFLELIAGQNVTWPDGPGKWAKGGEYFGEGPYLGMQRKYEFLVLPSEAAHVDYLTYDAGLRIKKSQRWHFVELGAITLVCHAQQGNLRQDPALHGHLAFNLAHNLYDGMLHYNYDTMVWLHEGLAHFMEREIDPKYNTFDSDEGAVAEETSKENWKSEVLKMIAAGTQPRMAELVTLKRYSELKLPHHFATWSMVDFLVKTRPDEFAKFLWALKRNFDSNGIPTGSNLNDLHRAKFKEIFGWSYTEFDEAWKAWCLTNYKQGPPKGSDPSNPGGSGVPGRFPGG